MAVPDAATDAQQHKRRVHPDHVCAVLATPVAAVATFLWVVELVNGQPVLVAGVTSGLWVATLVLIGAWLATSLERRLVVRLERIEGSRYRDGYADGFLDAVNHRGNGNQYERPTLRPVK